jgi:tetratricopeptide (TPR) repeat protein/DNA-binding XRE family transcriptional regulator
MTEDKGKLDSFGELLNQYSRRLGISDAELARTVGVRRQTIFRWREGVTARPRYREDVLRLADKLRLAPDERDKLLVAAGFQPETMTPVFSPAGQSGTKASPVTASSSDADVTSPEPEPGKPAKSVWSRPWVWLGGVLMILLVAILGVAVSFWGNREGDGPEATSVVQALTAKSGETVGPTKVPTIPAETVVLITHFANYAGGDVGYNVAGRLADALDREIRMLRLNDVHVAVESTTVGEAEQAMKVGEAVGAALVIFGEYDLGRVVVRFVHPTNASGATQVDMQREVADLQELSAVINTDLPQQVRSLALLALGQLYLNQGDVAQARQLLIQAAGYLADDAAVDQKTYALANFYVGIADQQSDPPQLEAAIAAYTEALAAWPQMISSRLNRSTAYQTRQHAGDLALALTDANQVIAAVPDWAAAYTNRASIRMRMGGEDNETLALADLDKALDLDPSLAEAYFNRATLRFQQGQSTENWAADLQEALALRPNHTGTLNQLCWNYALVRLPEESLPYCDQLISLDPKPLYRDSRGLAFALAGDYPAAIADFQAYIDWLAEQADPAAQATLAQRETWVEALQAGQDPFATAVLTDLRFGDKK